MTVAPQHRAGTPGSAGSAALREALGRLRLEGAIFFRAEFSEGWAFVSPDGPSMAGLLRPGAARIIIFHVVARGTCWVRPDGGERYWATAGDVITLPYGDRHVMGGVEDTTPIEMARILAPPPWQTLPVLRHGAGGDRTDIVCGYLHSTDPLFDPALRALPPAFVVRPPAAAAEWVGTSIEYALAASSGPASTMVATRLPELVLTEVLHLHLSTAPATDRGWLAALHDPVLAPALALLHARPERKWTVADLAGEVATSRSVLDERFRQVLGRSPIRYLTDWRMHVAENLLGTTDVTVANVARRTGYTSEEAFTRAFKRARGLPPMHWRTARSPSPVGVTS
ncbi:MAG: AraC family transcriptional regulator [Actinomycetota bacterium]|nr:AraC family transcriptional regulator [Actinomycetota bacterium]